MRNFELEQRMNHWTTLHQLTEITGFRKKYLVWRSNVLEFYKWVYPLYSEFESLDSHRNLHQHLGSRNDSLCLGPLTQFLGLQASYFEAVDRTGFKKMASVKKVIPILKSTLKLNKFGNPRWEHLDEEQGFEEFRIRLTGPNCSITLPFTAPQTQTHTPSPPTHTPQLPTQIHHWDTELYFGWICFFLNQNVSNAINITYYVIVLPTVSLIMNDLLVIIIKLSTCNTIQNLMQITSLEPTIKNNKRQCYRLDFSGWILKILGKMENVWRCNSNFKSPPNETK